MDESFSTQTSEPDQDFDPTETSRDELDTQDDLDVSGTNVNEVSVKPDAIFNVTDFQGQGEDGKVKETEVIF